MLGSTKELSLKNIVILNQFVGPTTIDTANAMCNAGLRVDLYAGNVSETTTKFDQAVRIHRRCAYRRLNTLQRLWTWSRFTFVTFVELLFKRKPFEVFAITNPPFNLFTVLFLKKIRGIPYHLLVFDVYPDAAVHFSSLRNDSLLVRLWSYLTRMSVKHANSVFTISERMCVALSKYATPDIPIHIIHNWADNHLICPISADSNSFTKQLGISDKRIVLYSGNFGKTHDIGTIVEAAKLLASHPQIHFLLIGEGEQKARIEELVATYNLRNVTLLPFTDSSVFPYSIASGEIAIVTLDSAAQSVSTPSKTYNSMAAGSAILALATDESELADLIKKHDMGIVVPPGEAANLAETIRQLFDDSPRLAELKSNARAASDDYTPRNASLYVQVILANA